MFNPKFFEEEFNPYAHEVVPYRRMVSGKLEACKTLRFNFQDTVSEMTDAQLLEYSALSAKADATGLAEDKIKAFDYFNKLSKEYWKDAEDNAREEREGHVF